jgi:hypothetical protein
MRPRQDFWTDLQPVHATRTWSPGRSYASKRSATRASSCFWALSPRNRHEAVLAPCNRARRVGHRDTTTSRLDRGLVIRTKAAATAGTILAVAALAGCGGSDSKSSGISDKFRNDYVAGCSSTGQTKAGCECIFDNLKDKQGVNTEAEFKTLSDKVKSATTSGNLSALPSEFRQAVLACKSQIVKPPGA